MSFSRDINRFSQSTQQRMSFVIRYVSLESLRRTVGRTAVKTGLAKGNWQVEIGSIPNSTLSRLDPDGGATIAQGESMIARIRGDDTVYIVNNLPYIIPLEYGGYPPGPNIVGGYSRRSPRGMVRVTVQEFEGIVMQGLRVHVS